ncbi:MAG: hypothetical protein AAGH15_15805 [Myxococcota bacterium]
MAARPESLALEGVRGASRRLGPAAALRALRALRRRLPPEERAKGAALFIELGLAAGDGAARLEAAELWREAGPRAPLRTLARMLDALIAGGDAPAAQGLLAAERARAGDAPASRYLEARARARLGDPVGARVALVRASDGARAGSALAAAIARARALGDQDAREAAHHAEHGGSDAETVALARLALGAPGRYARVRALDALRSVAARRPDAARVAAEHLDGRAITAIERDRVRAILAARGAEGKAALRRFDAREGGRSDLDEATARALRSARAVLERGTAGPERPHPSMADASLRAIAAMRRADPAAAEAALRMATALAPRVSAPALTAAWLGSLARGSLRAAAGALAERLVGAPGAVPRGWVRLAQARPDVLDATLDRLWRRGVLAGEPGACVGLGERRRREGWAAWKRGDHATARTCLREAKALLQRRA